MMQFVEWFLILAAMAGTAIVIVTIFLVVREFIKDC
jgi:hypothetical protein